MNAKELVQKTLSGKSTEIPVTIHGWGLYKFWLAGIVTGYEDEENAWSLSGAELADAEAGLYERFHPDTLHLGAGRSKFADEKREAYIRALGAEVKKLDSKSVIDEYITAVYQSESDVLESGIYSHVELLSRRYGDEVFITLNDGNPISGILDPHGLLGFEDGLVSLLTNGDMVAYLLYQLYDVLLERMKALKKSGADAYIGSETYCSADMISPRIYRDVVWPAQRHFYTGLREIELGSFCYFLGDLLPMLPDIKNLGIDALLIEARNKAVEIDVAEVYRQAEGAFTLYGNLNSIDILQLGSIADVERETRRQMTACSGGRFIMANDCPVSFGTPEENIDAMIRAAKTAGKR